MSVLSKIKDGFSVFRYGEQVTNPALWKAGGNAVSVLVPLIMGLVKLAGDFGYGVQLSVEDATAIAGGVIASVSFVLNNVTSRKAGLLPAKPADVLASEDVPSVSKANAAPLQPVPEAAYVTPRQLTEQEARSKY